MAKVKSTIKLSGTIDGTTYVNSNAYGAHTRKARGTYTPISLADGMKVSAVKQSKANMMAKIIFDNVNELAPGFKDGKFWSRLVKVFRAQQKMGDVISYLPFEMMEMREDYPGRNHGIFYLKSQPNSASMVLDINSYSSKAGKTFDLSILRIAVDDTFLTAYPSHVIRRELSNKLQHSEIVFDFPELPAGAQCLYVLKCERLKNEELEGTLAAKGVTFLKVDIY